MAGFLTRLEVMQGADTTWATVRPLVYRSDVLGAVLTVPKGTLTDFASVPRALPAAFALFGGTANAPACVHDWMYATQVYTREQADDVFREACLSIGIAPWRAQMMHWALRRFGGLAWDAHAREKT